MISQFSKDRPQRLCKMCGKCCRVVTTSTPFNELKKQALEGNQQAQDFLDVFEPFKSIEDAKKISSEIVDNILNHLKNNDNFNPNEITFYTCRYLKENNECGIYENRKDLCKVFPSTAWAIIPPDCGFEGWLFLKREEHKQKIRKLKEEALHLEVSLKYVQSNTRAKKIQRIINKINENIKLYGDFGPIDF